MPLPDNVSPSPSPSGFRFDASNVETDPNYPVITPNILQVDPHSFHTHRDVTTSGPFLAALPAFETPVVNPAYVQYTSLNGVFASASPDPNKISSISDAPLPIASDNPFYQTQRPLSDYSVSSYAHGAHDAYNVNDQDDFSNCFTPREAQPVYDFPESGGPPSFDLSFTHQTTADPQNLWFDDKNREHLW